MGTASEAFREALNAKGDRSLNEGAEKRRLENLVRARPHSDACGGPPPPSLRQ